MTGLFPPPSDSFDVFLVEDDQAAIRLTAEAFRDAGAPVSLRAARDGEQALAFLRADAADHRLPDLILLDLNLPRRGGLDVLAAVKNDPALNRIPVIVMSTSESASDIDRAYALRANCYISKPVDLGEFFQVVRLLSEFWLKTAKLPRSQAHA